MIGNIGDIGCGFPLSFCPGAAGKVEILLPADDRIVRAAEGNIVCSVIQCKCHGRKLRDRICIQYIDITAGCDIAEALTRTARFQCRFWIIADFTLVVIMRNITIPDLPDTFGIPVKPNDVFHLCIGKFSENQMIHFIHRIPCKRKISAPADIFKNTHTFFLFLSFTRNTQIDETGTMYLYYREVHSCKN